VTQSGTGLAPPHARVLDMITGYWISCGIHVAARLRIADLLANGPRPVADLAAAAGANAPTLYRLLRMLASRGVFREGSGLEFENTSLSEMLRSDVPGSMHGFAVMMVDEYNLDAYKELIGSVRTGETAFHKVFGMRAFEWLASHPEQAREFGQAMTSLSGMENPAVAEALDVTGIGRIVDVGGGHGSLLAAILKRNPELKGTIYDRPEVVANARQEAYVTEKGVADRCDLVAGNFFDSVPSGADACIMKYILHDWEDDLCVKILSNCRRAMGAGGKLLVVDTVVPPGSEPHWGKKLDINMLVLTGGRERTEKDFAQLFERSGFRLQRVIPTASALCIVEGVVERG
jgi:SAM-dependent methyltransferase